MSTKATSRSAEVSRRYRFFAIIVKKIIQPPKKMLRRPILCCLLVNAAMLCYAQLRRDNLRPSKKDNYTFDLPSHLMQSEKHECILTIYQDLLNGVPSTGGSPHLNLFSTHAQMFNTVRCLNGIQTGKSLGKKLTLTILFWFSFHLLNIHSFDTYLHSSSKVELKEKASFLTGSSFIWECYKSKPFSFIPCINTTYILNS